MDAWMRRSTSRRSLATASPIRSSTLTRKSICAQHGNVAQTRWLHEDHLRSLPLPPWRSEEHTSELQSLMRISYAVFCLKTHKQSNIIRCTQTTQAKTHITQT